MRVTITRMDGDLKKQTWDFALFSENYPPIVRLEAYRQYELPSKRHRKWRVIARWGRFWYLDNMVVPPLPEDVESEVRAYFAKQIKALPIER